MLTNRRQHLIEWVISRMKTDGGGLTLKRLYCKAVTADSSTSLPLSTTVTGLIPPYNSQPAPSSSPSTPARNRQSQQRDGHVAATLEQHPPTPAPKMHPNPACCPGSCFAAAIQHEAIAANAVQQHQLWGDCSNQFCFAHHHQEHPRLCCCFAAARDPGTSSRPVYFGTQVDIWQYEELMCVN